MRLHLSLIGPLAFAMLAACSAGGGSNGNVLGAAVPSASPPLASPLATTAPSANPTAAPSANPTVAPSANPTAAPSAAPTLVPATASPQGTNSPTATPVATPPVATTPLLPAEKSAERNLVQSELSLAHARKVAFLLKLAAAFIGVSTPLPACSAGTFLESSSISGNVTTVTFDGYSDVACAKHALHATTQFTAVNAALAYVTGNFQIYDGAGNVAHYESFTGTTNKTAATFSGALLFSGKAAAGAPLLDSFGIACTFSTPTSFPNGGFTGTDTCGFGDAMNMLTPGQALGVLAHDTDTTLYGVDTAQTQSSGLATVSVAPPNGLTLSQANGGWSISGGAVASNITLYGSSSIVNLGKPVTSFTCNDGTNNVAATMSIAETGEGLSTLSGAVVESSVRRGAFTADESGNGTITYGDGSTGTIAGLTIQS